MPVLTIEDLYANFNIYLESEASNDSSPPF